MARRPAGRWAFRTTALGSGLPSTWTLDLARLHLSSSRGESTALTDKGAALLDLLLRAAIETAAKTRMGWITADDVTLLPAWSGSRTATSLFAQIRRELRRFDRMIPGLVETPARARVRGPWRLRPRRLERVRGPIVDNRVSQPMGATSATDDPSRLFCWLEDAEPVWRHLHYFDKPGEAMSNLPLLQGASVTDPLLRNLALLSTAKRLREEGRYGSAARVLRAAEDAARQEAQVPVRDQLLGMCAVQRAWLAYRRGDLNGAERWLGVAERCSLSGGGLKLRGPMLNLRSLVRRARGRLESALQDLREAARMSILDGDLFHLFAVYHNLACLVSVQADGEPDPDRRRSLYELALTYSQRNHAYCHRYGVGQNSVLHMLLQVGLHRRLGQLDDALRIADEAEHLAIDTQNYPDALKAHQHKVSIWTQTGRSHIARRENAALVSSMGDSRLRRRFASVLVENLDVRVRRDA